MKKEILVFVCFLIGAAIANNQVHKYRTGVYYGTSLGFMDSLTVEVQIKNDAITKVRVIKHQEDRELGSIRKIPFLIKKEQGIESVDAISGATATSDAIKKAVEIALRKAAIWDDSLRTDVSYE